ncbi:MAG: Crp/Fnr family transcriptional regulator [Myxococcales bacterium]|nr:Crp/Fnr family transcriptional regulator [Myxococcales bacterium]MCB9532680.1 Crp/Fnr family transcriptional regulator [Myxococcales bacterium]MCB9533038.1 Crp/Fnr family transcriptional regulator [Myxococcales bacterium]
MATIPDAQPSSTVHFRAGEVLFEQGAPANHVFILNAGSVRLFRQVFEERVLLETLGRGNVCGDIAFAEGAQYPSTAIAVDDVEAVVVHRDGIESVLLQNPSVVARVVSRMAARLTYSHFRIAAFALRTPTGRIMLQLRHEAERAGGLDGAAFVPIPYDLPEAVALERGAVDAVLRSLATDGLLELDTGGRFRVTDPAGFDRKLRYLELHDRFELG